MRLLLFWLSHVPPLFCGLLLITLSAGVRATPKPVPKPVLDLAPGISSGPILAAASHLKVEPGASAVLLLDEGRTVVYQNYTTLSCYHTIIKLLDQSAVRRYTEFPLSHPTMTAVAALQSAYIIKADGRILEVTDKANRSAISFPLLTPGDLLDITYQVKDSPQHGLAHPFWAAWSFNQTDAPVRLSRYVLITPQGLALSTRSHGSVPIPSVHDCSQWRIREWRVDNLPAHPVEVMAVPEDDSNNWLDLSAVPSWAKVAGWYEALSTPLCVPGNAVRAVAAALTKNSQTDDEKICALQEFVSHEIQYQRQPFRLSGFVPADGQEVLQRRYGDAKDKASLLKALLAAVGVNSDLVLLSDRGYGLTPYLPSLRFGHAIVQVHRKHGVLFVDPIADHLDFADLPIGDQGVPALVVAPTTTGLIETPVLPVDSASDQQVYRGSLGADGSLHGECDWTLTGRQAWDMRLALREVPQANQQEMRRRLIGFLMHEAIGESENVTHSDDPDLPLSFHFVFHADHYAVPSDTLLVMPLPWSKQAKDSIVAALAAEITRTQDLETASSRGLTRSVVSLRLPPGYAPQEMPADVHQDSPYGSFQMHYAVKGDLLTATRDADMTALRVPAADVPKYVAFLKAINEEMGRQIVLRKL